MKRLIVSLIIVLSLFNYSYSQETDHLKIKSFTDKDSYSNKDTIKIAFKVNIKEGLHINSFMTDDPSLIKTEIKTDSKEFAVTGNYFPPDKLLKFEFSDNKVRVYEGEFIAAMVLKPSEGLKDGEYKLTIKFIYQSCNNTTCFPPQTVSIDVRIKINNQNPSKVFTNKDVFTRIDFTRPVSSLTDVKSTGDTKLTEYTRQEGQNPDEGKVENIIKEKGIFLGILLIFIWGLALNLTPCIYPLIPITISYFGAQASGNKFRSIMMGVFYALGMSVTYSLLGLVAALTGSILGTALQNPLVIIFIALIFIALASSMFGLWEIRVPQKLAVAGNQNRSGLFGSLLMGLLVGFIAAPCIGPIVLSLLVYVGKLGNPLIGFLLFFILSMGLGVPYIFLAAFSSSINKLPRSGEWMIGVKLIFGFVLLIMALNTLGPIIPKDIFAVMFPLVIIFSGFYLIVVDRKGNNSPIYTRIKQILAVCGIIYGAWILKPESEANKVEWKMINTLENIEISIKTGNKPVMIDFYADWCAQCKELDQYTYTDKDVSELSKSFNTIKIDLTKENKPITDRFNIKGLPVVIFMNSKGEEIKEMRVTGFLKPEEFIKRMKTTEKR
ncbi:protein-disulfide reductase DsbD [bacterium]|nr:MAG: protein-disulfide reductase DsbD [bacterium]